MLKVVKVKNVRDPFSDTLEECTLGMTPQLMDAIKVVENIAKEQLNSFGFDVNNAKLSFYGDE